ncbi:hypothetical protein MIND_01323000 [Mycena indigotica]|uniref:Endonuclease/exonuclease/phosphatase domain-containing protein n=1 Tax=Mycena indigotica TaxID=2126181 RepID=A0A8H6S1A3_9AGAR|nr:uncharacterized protein MIND_01323000 [Mycena indigotica]KAF7290818.1 hypothetical protein MIND_01323000 [Mycena indigotica]
MSWNLQATPYKRVERAQLIFDRIFRANLPDVLLLQEVNRDVRKAILADPKLRGGFLMSDADSEDDSAFFPFSTMTLLSRKRFAAGGVSSGEDQLQKMVISDAFRMTLPSRDDRDALCIDVSDPVTPGHVLRLINVHLESLDAAFRRGFQLYLMNALLREAGCSGGVIAGSFNAFEPYDLTLVEQHGLLDAWVKLHGPLPRADVGHWRRPRRRPPAGPPRQGRDAWP